MRVALMVTCVNDAMFPEVGQAVVRLLRRLGVDVDFPAAQTCCGQPMVNTGYLDEAVPVVRTFVDAFAGYDAVVAPSGSCAGSARHQHAIVARRSGDAALVDGAARTSAMVHELSEFLVDVLGVRTSARTSRTGSPTTRPATRCGCWGWATARPACCGRCGDCGWSTSPRPRSAAASVAPSRSRTPTRRWPWAPTRRGTCGTPAPRCWSPATARASCTSAGCCRASSPASASCTWPRCSRPPRAPRSRGSRRAATPPAGRRRATGAGPHPSPAGEWP